MGMYAETASGSYRLPFTNWGEKIPVYVYRLQLNSVSFFRLWLRNGNLPIPVTSGKIEMRERLEEGETKSQRYIRQR
jgi:hypothetical protein